MCFGRTSIDVRDNSATHALPSSTPAIGAATIPASLPGPLRPILDAVATADSNALFALVHPYPVACRVAPLPTGSTPERRPGEPDGALVQVTGIGNCEGGPFWRPDELPNVDDELHTLRFYAIYRVAPDFPLAYIRPTARYAVMFSHPPHPHEGSQDLGYELLADDVGLVGLHASCIQTPSDLASFQHFTTRWSRQSPPRLHRD